MKPLQAILGTACSAVASFFCFALAQVHNFPNQWAWYTFGVASATMAGLCIGAGVSANISAKRGE